ncbi:MAG TPA: glycosyltransferase [Thermoplasmata archaeon]|nr:glycosyltransferase [Thermoplasmata archaeon]
MNDLSNPAKTVGPAPAGPVRPITVVVPLPPSYRGGTEEYAYRLIEQYSRTEPVQVLTTRVRVNDNAAALSVGSASVTSLNGRELFERPLVSGAAAWRTLRDAVTASRVVQLHMPFPFVERRVCRWAQAAGVPTVLTYHMDAEFGTSRVAGLVTWAYRTFSSVPALQRCDVVVSNSLGYARASPVLTRFLPKVRVIFQGIDASRLVATAPGGEPLLRPTDASARKVVFIGRLVPYKGLPYLLEAVAKLRKGGEAVELFIAGKGPAMAELRSRADALGLPPAVQFLGFVPDDDLPRLYREADVVVSSSISLLESTPITLMEAMAIGTPVVGTSLPGADETLPNDGIYGRLVPPKDSDALAEAIRALVHRSRPARAIAVRS